MKTETENSFFDSEPRKREENYTELIETSQPTGLVGLNKNGPEKSRTVTYLQDISAKDDRIGAKSRGGKQLKSTQDIIESIAMIRDLISANGTLREKVEGLKAHIQKQEKETYTLMQENQVLRERWEMVSYSLQPESSYSQEEAPIAVY